MMPMTIQELLQMYKPIGRAVKMTFISSEHPEWESCILPALTRVSEPDTGKYGCAVVVGELADPERIYFFKEISDAMAVDRLWFPPEVKP